MLRAAFLTLDDFFWFMDLYVRFMRVHSVTGASVLIVQFKHTTSVKLSAARVANFEMRIAVLIFFWCASGSAGENFLLSVLRKGN